MHIGVVSIIVRYIMILCTLLLSHAGKTGNEATCLPAYDLVPRLSVCDNGLRTSYEILASSIKTTADPDP